MNALCPETWPFPLKWLPRDIYVVGGAVRDALLHRRLNYLDLDFVLPQQAVEVARSVARRSRAGFVVLDEERQIARVVFEGATADFALQEGDTLEADLRRRDFTVNAIAYHPHAKQRLDPLGGWDDLQGRQLRMVSSDNLRGDPLRLLRAYRQAAQLGFDIEPATRAAIRQLAPAIARVAAERVKTELSYLLDGPAGAIWLQRAWSDGVLRPWFGSAPGERVGRVAAVDEATAQLGRSRPAFANWVTRPLRPSLKTNAIALAKLACLLDRDADAARGQLLHLKYSRIEIKGILAALSYLPPLEAIDRFAERSIRDWYLWFEGIGEWFGVAALLAIAVGVPFDLVLTLVDRYLDPNDPIAHPQPLIDGKTLLQLGVPRGPKVGKYLEELNIARARGEISTAEEAIAWVKQCLADGKG